MMSVAIVFAVVVTGGTVQGRNLERRMNFSRLYGEGSPATPPPASTQEAAELSEKTSTKISTTELEGVSFETRSGKSCSLKLSKNRSWVGSSEVFETVFEWKRLTGLRFGTVDKGKSGQSLVLLVDQPGVPPLEGMIERLPAEERSGDLAPYAFRFTLPVGSVADGETLTLYGR
jgi:hypothetical protein